MTDHPELDRRETFGGGSHNATLNGVDREPTGDDKPPDRLDEACRYALSRIEAQASSVEIVIRFFGWDGRGVRTLDQLACTFGLTHEPLREIIVSTTARLQHAQFVLEAIEKSIALASQLVPILDVELCEALLKARLCYVRFTCGALVAAANIFRDHAPFEEVGIGDRQALVPSGKAECIDQFAARVRRHLRKHGCGQIAALTKEFQQIIGAPVSHRFVEAVARIVGPFEWLDRANGYFWYVSQPSYRTNPLVNQIRCIFCVMPRLGLPELRSAIASDHRRGNAWLPENVLGAICKRLLFVRLEGDIVAGVPSLVERSLALDKAEATLLRTLRDHESMCGWLSDGKIFVGCRLNAATLDSGVLRVHEPISSFIEGEYELAARGNHQKLARIEICQRACWDISPLLRWYDAETGDILVLIFDRRTHSAAGIVADEAIAAHILSPEVDLKALMHRDGYVLDKRSGRDAA